ncbi:hypothetical protein ONE63_000021 [Megalurothrips usitatus]|uniref:Uncharacterized protein n=1 Tax=Megalurothrips usitatus TaxID=439358 RepID=A0AAV7Y411_9NEOP|nr:hypothetical protein ONE63_000021 [Megalurothrips usitatus]
MTARPDFRLDGNHEAPMRTKEEHNRQVSGVESKPSCSSRYGVKRSCPLNDVPFFHCVEGSVFDSFHDILEGVAPYIIKLVLRHFIVRRQLFSESEFNIRVASFCYGSPDSKNKPSANFQRKMFTSRKNLRQGGCQMWCLMRALPFLICDGIECSEEDKKHMEVVFLLQDITRIVFAFEVSPEDLDRLDSRVYRLLEQYKCLLVDTHVEVEDEDEEDVDDVGEGGPVLQNEGLEAEMEVEDNEGEVEPGDDTVETEEPRAKAKKWIIHLFNKMHHLKHYSDMIRLRGPAIRLWCAKFEGRLKIFRQHSAVYCNFVNIPKTMARMFQLANILKDDEESPLEFQQGLVVTDHNILRSLNIRAGEELVMTNSATFRREEYRPGLFVTLLASDFYPKFALISNVFVHQNQSVFLHVKPWEVLCLSAKYNCFKVSPDDQSLSSTVNVLSLQNFRTVAPWCVRESPSVYLSPRTIFV